jgi:hypothetical protein
LTSKALGGFLQGITVIFDSKSVVICCKKVFVSYVIIIYNGKLEFIKPEYYLEVKMEKRINFIIVIILLSLGLNIYLFMDFRYIKQQVQGIVSDSSTNGISSEISTLTRKINEIKEENKWIMSKDFIPNTEASSPETIHLDLEWSFKEIEKGANVTVLYRNKSDSDWTKVQAVHLKENFFRAPFILSPKYEYEYQIVAEGTSIKTSEIAKIPTDIYRKEPLEPISLSFSEDDKDIATITIGYKKKLFDFYKPQRAEAKIFKDSKLVSTVELEFENTNEQTYTQIEFIKDATKILLEYEYEDGQIYLAEIFPIDGGFKHSEYRVID